MKYILSIIIPVYKVEEYINECLESIFTQLPNSVEIILINDGTPDQSIEIIKSTYSNWLAKDQVVLLEQKNAGPGSARNKGLAVARSKYIGFLDSDDILLDNYFSIILDIVSQYETDIIEFGFQRFYKIEDIINGGHQSLYPFKGLHNIKEVRNDIFSVGTWFPSIRVYKKNIFETIRFPEGVFYEDLMIIPHIYLKDLTAYFISQPLIGYRFNPNSTTALHNKSHAMDMYTFYTSLTELKPTIPIDILKIKTARSIVYFHNELGTLGFSFINVISEIKKIKKQLSLLKILKYPDLLFFLFPKVYLWIDKIRLMERKK